MTSSPAPSRRAVLLDFDGTYAEHGVVPRAHVHAVRRARAAGHAVLLCTGRPLSAVEPEVLAELDGAITSAGARVDVGGRTLGDARLDPGLVTHAVDVLEAHSASYCLESPEAMHVPERSLARLRAVFSSPTLLANLAVPEDLRSCSVAKIVVWDGDTGIEQLSAEIGPGLRALPNSISGDVARSGELQNARCDKADGAALVAAHLGLGMEEMVGAGDGMNDVGMLAAVGTAIGIEGAPEPVLRHADLVVPGPARHGLVTAFERCGLI